VFCFVGLIKETCADLACPNSCCSSSGTETSSDLSDSSVVTQVYEDYDEPVAEFEAKTEKKLEHKNAPRVQQRPQTAGTKLFTVPDQALYPTCPASVLEAKLDMPQEDRPEAFRAVP
jgi:hypothetical protein